MGSLLSIHDGGAAVAALEHFRTGGKRLRARLALHAASSLGLPVETAVAIAAASELVHNASLVHDDIQDGSELRRGAPTLWARHGRDLSICAGDLMISAAYGALSSAPAAQLPTLFARLHLRVSEVIAGQSADLSAKEAPVTTVADYRRIAAGKSAPLLGLPLELALVAAGRSDVLPQVEAAANCFAVAYQMADDIEDAECDLASGAMNIVAIIARDGSLEAARVHCRSMVVRDYRLARDLARRLPSGCGALIANFAEEFLQRTEPQSLSA